MISRNVGVAIIISLSIFHKGEFPQSVNAFTAPISDAGYIAFQRRISLALPAEKDQKQKAINPFTKASWYAVEAFGKTFGQKKDSDSSVVVDTTRPPQSMEETRERLKRDNERFYFLSGEVDELIYDEQCTFADPFVSFQGRRRFVENLENLGSFITDYKARPLPNKRSKDEVDDDDLTVESRFMVKLELNLPWKPVLAWGWRVACTIDPETNLIVRHEEKWDIEPLDGVKQVFRPSSRTSLNTPL